LTTNISRRYCRWATIFGRMVQSNKLYQRCENVCVCGANLRRQRAPKVTEAPSVGNFEKIAEKIHSGDPQISFARSTAHNNIYFIPKIKEIYFAVSEKQRVVAKTLPPLFSKIKRARVRAKTYLLGHVVFYHHMKFDGSSHSGSRDKWGSQKFLTPHNSAPWEP
jgi:hypothetical protein